MRFLVDRCAGRRVAEWLREQGHDVLEARTLGPDPGDLRLLEIAVEQHRIVVTIDTDFPTLVAFAGHGHHGMIRLPDVPAAVRITMLQQAISRHFEALQFLRSAPNGTVAGSWLQGGCQWVSCRRLGG